MSTGKSRSLHDWIVSAPPILATFYLVIAIMAMVVLVWVLVQPVEAGDSKEQYIDLMNRQLWVASVRMMVTYGLGVMCCTYGLLFSWTKVREDVDFRGAIANGRLVFKGRSGFGLVIMGAVLIAIGAFSPTQRIGPPKEWGESPWGGPESGVAPPYEPSGAVPPVIPFDI